MATGACVFPLLLFRVTSLNFVSVTTWSWPLLQSSAQVASPAVIAAVLILFGYLHSMEFGTLDGKHFHNVVGVVIIGRNDDAKTKRMELHVPNRAWDDNQSPF
jgi:hypothetical protein